MPTWVESLSDSDSDSFKYHILTLNTETLVSKSKYWIYLKKKKTSPRIWIENHVKEKRLGLAFRNTDCEPSSAELSNYDSDSGFGLTLLAAQPAYTN